ncbi:MAG: hypothetical protein ACRD2R_00295, partial [Terriglobales bacterium]
MRKRRRLLVTMVITSLFLCVVASADDYAIQKLWVPYWTVEPGFRSTLELKNNRTETALTVEMSVYLLSGPEYYLPSVHLQPRETRTLDLNQVLSGLLPASGDKAAQQGQLELWFHSENPSALMGSVSVSNPEKGIAWNFFLYPRRTDPEAGAVPVRGVFWFPNKKADGFVALHNVSDATAFVTANFQVKGRSYALPELALPAGLGQKLELRKELRSLGLSEASAGGVEFTYRGAPDALKAHGVLFDGRGFSAEMDFTRLEYYEQSRTVYLRTPRFALGAADPKLGLPLSTRFQPTVALHNFGQRELIATLKVGYPGGQGTQEIALAVAVAANDSVVLPLAAALAGVVPPSWASLEVSYSESENSLGGTMVSVSQDGEHSIRSVLNWVEGSTREGWYWRVDASHNTFISMLNTDSEEARVAIALDYYLEGERRTYKLPERTLPAKASSLVDVGEIIARGEPDAEGTPPPPAVSFGGYQVRKVDPRAGQTVTTEALVFDTQRKNFVTFYNTCCGINPGSVAFFLPSFTGAPGFIGTAGAQGQDYCGGGTVDLPATFSSGNTSISTVNSAGSVTGVAPGATNTNTLVSYFKQKTVDTCTN